MRRRSAPVAHRGYCAGALMKATSIVNKSEEAQT